MESKAEVLHELFHNNIQGIYYTIELNAPRPQKGNRVLCATLKDFYKLFPNDSKVKRLNDHQKIKIDILVRIFKYTVRFWSLKNET